MVNYSSFDYNPTNIIKYPIITEKSINLSKINKYSFSVALLANKSIIKKSIEYLFNVKVIKINTLRVVKTKKSQNKRFYSKKVIVTLKSGNTINLFTEN